jgi:hypothetical protein
MESVDCSVPLAINGIMANELTVSPNPTSDELYLNSDSDISFVEVYSLTSEKILEVHDVSSGQPINISNLEEGIYFLAIYSFDGVTRTVKIIKK